jgi:hypothetical protein
MTSVIGRFSYNPRAILPRHIRRLSEIAPFYTDEMTRTLLIPIVTQTYDVSLRVVDWFVTNYTKRHKIIHMLNVNGTQEPISIFSLYKDSLRHWRRKLFDPFRRRERVYFSNPDNISQIYETTCAQLNFLKWAFSYGILEQARLHLKQVEADMNKTLNESKKRRATERINGRRKRTELTPASTTKCQVYIVKQEIEFDLV